MPRRDKSSFGTHLPLLTKYLFSLPRTLGIILEHGAGPYSSLILSEFAHHTGRERHLIEPATKFRERYGYGDKLFHTTEEWIDQSEPVWLALVDGDRYKRQLLLEHLKRYPGVTVVAHDTEDEVYGYDFSGYDVVEECLLFPETLVLRPKQGG